MVGTVAKCARRSSRLRRTANYTSRDELGGPAGRCVGAQPEVRVGAAIWMARCPAGRGVGRGSASIGRQRAPTHGLASVAHESENEARRGASSEGGLFTGLVWRDCYTCPNRPRSEHSHGGTSELKRPNDFKSGCKGSKTTKGKKPKTKKQKSRHSLTWQPSCPHASRAREQGSRPQVISRC